MTTTIKRTNCLCQQTQGDIQSIVSKFNGHNIEFRRRGNSEIIRFQAQGRQLRYELPCPWDETTLEAMRAWRHLYWYIKGQLQAVESGIQSFEEVFLAQIEDEDGRTIAEKIIPSLPPPKAPPSVESPAEIIIKCIHCGTKNRFPPGRKPNHAVCGRCHGDLYDPFPKRVA